MKKLILTAMMVAGMAACSWVTSAGPGATNATGEVWYIKSTTLGGPYGFPLGQTIYFCPASDNSSGPPRCIEADVQ